MKKQLELPGLALGCWPLAGMTRAGVTREAAVETVAAAIDHGITHLDTAYCYGENGESERAIAQAIKGRQNEVTIASKCGIHWQAGKKQTVDGHPDKIIQEVQESLDRLQLDRLDLLYLHTLPIQTYQSRNPLGRFDGFWMRAPCVQWGMAGKFWSMGWAGAGGTLEAFNGTTSGTGENDARHPRDARLRSTL